MDETTRRYLSGRFGDYYRGQTIDPPPAPHEREWGHIPWTAGSGTTMIRHQSHLDLGDLDTFLRETAPRHVYFSAARYDDPGADTMSRKGWREADLVFDLDADHLPGVDPETTSYAAMLAACKEALFRLLEFLEVDFGVEELEIVFSGSRGYHVHVRDPAFRPLESDARREIVEYVTGADLDPEQLIRTVSADGTTRRVLANDGGWGRRTHERLVAFADELRSMDEPAAIDRLTSFEGIGEGRASTILGAIDRNPTAIREGNLEAGGPGIRLLAEAIAAAVADEQAAPIDEPVTTDVHRLIRLPGSLHGGSGLAVTPIERSALESFDPLVDAVPDRFADREIAIEADAERTVELLGDRTKVPAGRTFVPEPVGIFLMARGEARKAREDPTRETKRTSDAGDGG